MKKVVLIVVMLFIIVFSNKLSADSVDKLLYGVRTFTLDGTFYNDTWLDSPSYTPITIISRSDFTNYVALTDVAFSFTSPVVGMANAYTIEVIVDLESNVREDIIENNITYLAHFEQGNIANEVKNVTFEHHYGSYGGVRIKISDSVTLNENTNLSTIGVSLVGTLYSLSCSEDNPCTSVKPFWVKVKNVEVSVTLNTDPSLSLITGIGNQLDSTNSKLNDINNKTDITNSKLDNIDSSITDSDVDVDSSFFDSFTDNDHGLSGIVTAPLRAINKLTDSCSPITFNVLDEVVTLPCGDTLFWNKEGVAEFKVVWNLLVGGPLMYMLLKKLFKVVEGLKNPDDDRVEVVDL